MSILLPKDNLLHDQFQAMAGLMVEAAACLHASLKAGPATFAETAVKMTDYESKADKLGMTMFNHLHKSFMTPYDPEDILALIHYLDDVMDGLEDVAHRLSAYQLSAPPDAMVRMSELLAEAAKAMLDAVKALATKGDVISHCMRLSQYESEADSVTRDAISGLFKTEKDAIELIKCKEIYEYFERTADAYKHVATVLGRIQVKGG